MIFQEIRQAVRLLLKNPGLTAIGTCAMGVEPFLGRAFAPDEGKVPGRDAIALLSYEQWVNQFERDPGILGRNVRLNGIDFKIIGRYSGALHRYGPVSSSGFLRAANDDARSAAGARQQPIGHVRASDLLEYSRAGEVGEATLEPVKVDKVVGDAITNLQSAIAENSADVSLVPLPVVTANPLHLTQVFENRIANALKYRSAEPPRISVAAAEGAHDWIISVEDNGIGVPAEYQTRIFGISSASTEARIRARASAWRRARKSWTVTAAPFGWSRNRGRDRGSRLRSRGQDPLCPM